MMFEMVSSRDLCCFALLKVFLLLRLLVHEVKRGSSARGKAQWQPYDLWVSGHRRGDLAPRGQFVLWVNNASGGDVREKGHGKR